MLKSYKKITKYLKDHHNYNAFVHMFAGAAVGVMIVYPFVGSHPVRWATVLLGIAVLGHLYPILTNSK